MDSWRLPDQAGLMRGHGHSLPLPDVLTSRPQPQRGATARPGRSGKREGRPWGDRRPSLLLCKPLPLHSRPAACEPGGVLLEDRVAAQVAVQDGDVEEAGLVRVTDPLRGLGEGEGLAVARVGAPAVQGFPAGEKLGLLELQLLHRHSR